MRSYRDLEIYKISFGLGVRIHKASLKLPQHELYEEGGQVRKSTKGITSCIVEGYGRRRYKAEFIKFLVYAHASCDETILHLNYIKATHNVDQKEYQELIDSFDELGAKINRFIDYVDHSWNKGWNTKREGGAPHSP